MSIKNNDFYITILSNTFSIKYILPEAINLNENNWHVAVTDFTLINPINYQIYKNDRMFCSCTKKNKIITNFIAPNNYSFDSISSLISEINTLLAPYKIRLLYNHDTKYIIIANLDSENKYNSIIFYDTIAAILGFKTDVCYFNKQISLYPVDLYGGIYNLYLYLPIIRPHYIGNIQAPLLRIYTLNRKNKINYVNYKFPYYYPISIKLLTELFLEVRDVTGRIFVNTISNYYNISLTLHFKQL